MLFGTPVVRQWLASNDSVASKRTPPGRSFRMTKYPSDAAGLRYKMLTLQRDFLLPVDGLKDTDLFKPLRADQLAPSLKECAYAIRLVDSTRFNYNKPQFSYKTTLFPTINSFMTQRGTGKARRSRMSLGLLPVRSELTSRTANIVCLPEHEIWLIRDGPALKAYLQRSFPQLSIDNFVSDEVSYTLHCNL